MCTHVCAHADTGTCTCVDMCADTCLHTQTWAAHTPRDAPGRRPPRCRMASMHRAGCAEACHCPGRPWVTACRKQEGLEGGRGSRRCSCHPPPHTRTLTLAIRGLVCRTGALRGQSRGQSRAAVTGRHGHPGRGRGEALATWQPGLGHSVSTCVCVCVVCAHTWV